MEMLAWEGDETVHINPDSVMTLLKALGFLLWGYEK